MTEPNFFIVCTRGQTAGRWLWRSLNHHPDVFCLIGVADLDAHEGHRRLTDQDLAERIKNQAELDPQKLAALLEKVRPAKVYGAIHRHSTYVMKPYMPSPQLRAVVNLVRNPVARIEALYGHWDKTRLTILNDHFNQAIINHQAWVNGIAEKYKLDISDLSTRSFLGSIISSQDWAGEIKYLINELGGTLEDNIPMERLTTDVEYYLKLFERLTGIRKVDDTYIRDIFGSRKAARNKYGLARLGTVFSRYRGNRIMSDSTRTRKYKTPKKLFFSWEPWKQAAICDYFEKHDVIATHEAVGYDLSYLKPAVRAAAAA